MRLLEETLKSVAELAAGLLEELELRTRGRLDPNKRPDQMIADLREELADVARVLAG